MTKKVSSIDGGIRVCGGGKTGLRVRGIEYSVEALKEIELT